MFRHIHHVTVAALFIVFTGCVRVETESKRLPDAMNLPAIREANQTRAKLQSNVQEARQIGNELEAITSEISRQRITLQSSTTDKAIKNLIETTQKLRESALAILEKGPRFLDKIDSFSTPLATAPATYAKVAKLFRKFADEEPYADVAKDYRQTAVLFDNLAVRTEAGGATLHKRYNREAIMETLRYIRHQERFLDRLEAALRSQDFEIRELEKFLDEIEIYVKKFEQLRTQIKDLNAALQGLDDQSITPQPQPPRTSKTAVTEPADRAATSPRQQEKAQQDPNKDAQGSEHDHETAPFDEPAHPRPK
jgi:hypothetical protein